MEYQAIIKTPFSLSVLDVDGAGDYIIGNDVVGELATMRAEWPESPCPDGGTMMPGTRVHNSQKLNHVVLSIASEDPLMLLEGMISGYGLEWTVEVLEYLRPEDKGEFPADKNPDPALIDWMADVFDVNDNPVRPTLPVALNRWSGCVQMVVPE